MAHFLKLVCFMACAEIILKFGLMIGVFFPAGLLLLVLLTIHLVPCSEISFAT
jgi:hypothetical protein